jgi:N-acetylmuramoyl-L-alanine amidase
VASPLHAASGVNEARERLARLGHGPFDDGGDVIGPATAVAIQAFQRERGLPITGELDEVTMATLVEAGWSLGARLLFLSRPLLRGDDVAELQESLALLGFDPGRIDGIYGSQTARALEEFQANRALEASGVLTRESLLELTRVSTRAGGRRPVTEARDAAWLRPRHARQMVVLTGDAALVSELADLLAGEVETVGAAGRPPEEAAALANDRGAGLVIALGVSPSRQGLSVRYFATHKSRSLIGEALAEDLARAVRARTSLAVEIAGMSVPVLRETVMPALELCVGALDEAQRRAVVEAAAGAAARLFDSAR